MRKTCAALSALGVVFGVLQTSAHDPVSTKVTWSREISALVERRCLSCHARGGFAPFSLATYDEARPWAVAIKEEVLAGLMPPWGAAPGIGHFANDRRLTRHEMELIAAWVDGGAPEKGSGTMFAKMVPAPTTGTVVPLASAIITGGAERTASVTLQLPAGYVLTGWTFEPGTPAIVTRVDLELGTRWLGAWTPGDAWIDFPADAGAPLAASSLFTTRITYRAPEQRTVDYSRLRLRMTQDARPRTVRGTTVVRSWRPVAPVDVFAVRPTRDEGKAAVVARFADGRVEPVGVFEPPTRSVHPTYRMARPLALPAGARIETTGPVRLLYTDGATRTVKPNVRTRPRR